MRSIFSVWEICFGSCLLTKILPSCAFVHLVQFGFPQYFLRFQTLQDGPFQNWWYPKLGFAISQRVAISPKWLAPISTMPIRYGRPSRAVLMEPQYDYSDCPWWPYSCIFFERNCMDKFFGSWTITSVNEMMGSWSASRWYVASSRGFQCIFHIVWSFPPSRYSGSSTMAYSPFQ